MGFLAYLAFILWAAKGHDKKSAHNPDSADNKSTDNQNIIPPRVQIGLSAEHEADERTHREKQYALHQSTKRVTWLTFWAVFIYAGITLAIYSATKKSADAAKDAADAAKQSATTAVQQFHIDERAWIGIVADNPPLAKPPNPIAVHLKIQNLGHTPAKNCILRARIDVAKDESTVRFDFEKGSGLSINTAEMHTLLPGAIVRGTIVQAEDKPPHNGTIALVTLNKAMRRRINSGARVFVHGRLSYSDVFKTDHWTDFCFVYPSFNPLRSKTEPPFSNCDTHNDIDDN